MSRDIVIGTRGSRLALWQAEWIQSILKDRHPTMGIALKRIKTSGDKITDVPLAKVGGKGLFVKEIEEALLRREIDLAVHSMKDVPTVIPEGLHLAAVTVRENPRDALISRNGHRLKDLPSASRVGTSSLRRMAHLYHARPDLSVLSLRGNLDTRLRKLKSGEMDAIVVAAAGLQRMGWEEEATEYLDPEVSLPAIGQGALGIECRIDDPEINPMLAPLDHADTRSAVTAERALLRLLEGGCQVPIAAYATVLDGRILLKGLISSLDGKDRVQGEEEGRQAEAQAVGERLAQRLYDGGGRAILEAIFANGS